ncbi:MAG: phosphatidate cytidylyltransferase [Flavobacteriales bacterium]|nr:phosphatidate cytidylyltransferase [Flavobacteriales bacterium]|tara:strand:+ start:15052 stop:15873 length:822 start_codon:yes stop_codon:yes gene_type:complete
MSKSNLITRTITGLLYGLTLIASLVINYYTFYIFFFIVLVLGLKEFYELIEKKDIIPQKFLGFVISIGLYVSSYLINVNKKMSFLTLILFLGFIFLLFAVEIFKNKKNSLPNIGSTIFGVIYIALPLSLLTFLAFDSDNQYNYNLTLGMFILVWLSDVGGYIVGVNFGKHKFFERISPKKTWEGVGGSLILCIAGSCFLYQFLPIMNIYMWVVFGVLVFLGSVIGDLIESKLKRSANIKDSGNILPGHGGILDRFDSVLFVIPIVYIFKFFIL